MRIAVQITFCFVFITMLVGLSNIISDYNKQVNCYKTLLNEDEIEIGCGRYFEEDEWYQEYLRDLRLQRGGE